MVVMDVFSRRIIGFGVERADLSGASFCRMFNQIIAGKSLPPHLSSDLDPLFWFHRWLSNLRILEVEEIKSIPYVPVSHPLVERLIGTIRRKFLDHMLIWERRRPGAKAGRVQNLLQRPSRSPVALRTHSGRTIWPAAGHPRRPYRLRLAEPLPWPVPNANRGDSITCQGHSSTRVGARPTQEMLMTMRTMVPIASRRTFVGLGGGALAAALAAPARGTTPPGLPAARGEALAETRFRTIDVRGPEILYREAASGDDRHRTSGRR